MCTRAGDVGGGGNTNAGAFSPSLADVGDEMYVLEPAEWCEGEYGILRSSTGVSSSPMEMDVERRSEKESNDGRRLCCTKVGIVMRPSALVVGFELTYEPVELERVSQLVERPTRFATVVAAIE